MMALGGIVLKEIYLTSKSLTLAQKMKSVLRSGGIFANIVRPDIEITQNSCAYAVSIEEVFLPEAIEMLSLKGIMPVGIFVVHGNRYEEIRL